jgi:hypothetical protein
MQVKVRRTAVIIEEKREEAGRVAETPLLRVAVVAVVQNPYVSEYVEDLSPMIAASADLGREMARLAMRALGNNTVQSYGKAGIVGLAGEQEHANALLTTTFAEPFRAIIKGSDAWISSFTKVGTPGTMIDVPMNHVSDVYVRSHYDGMSIMLAGTPMPDEIAVMFCMATRGRLNARVGGLKHEDVRKKLQLTGA